MEIISLYKNIAIYFSVAFLIALVITPMVAKFAKTINAVDLPAYMRSRVDKTKAQRLHTTTKLRLGGMAIIIAFIITNLISNQTNTQIIGLLIGALILSIFGFLDDKFELSPKLQLLSHIIAASIAIIAGVRFTEIDIAGIYINLSSIQFELLTIFDNTFKIILPGDIFTMIWILVLINAVNWMCGIDALGESISIIMSIALVLIGVKTGNSEIAITSAILAGSIIGFLPYNFPPSKILGGTIGDVNFGYLLSTLAIMSEAKLSTTLLLLCIPILDMIYVLFRRILEHKVINPIKLLGISGRIHLHHRILNTGFDPKYTLYIEISFFIILTVIALYFENIGIDRPYIHIIIISLLSTFVIISYLRKFMSNSKKKRIQTKKAKVVRKLTPEEKYKY